MSCFMYLKTGSVVHPLRSFSLLRLWKSTWICQLWLLAVRCLLLSASIRVYHRTLVQACSVPLEWLGRTSILENVHVGSYWSILLLSKVQMWYRAFVIFNCFMLVFCVDDFIWSQGVYNVRPTGDCPLQLRISAKISPNVLFWSYGWLLA